MGVIAKVLVDKNGRLKRPSQTDGLEYVSPTASPSEPWVLPAQVNTEEAVFGIHEELQKEVESLPDAEADLRIITPRLKHQKQRLHFMMNTPFSVEAVVERNGTVPTELALSIYPSQHLRNLEGKSRRMSSLIHLAFTCIMNRSES